MKRPIISPSVLNADLVHFDNEVKKIKDAGMNWIHFDVMDGRFVEAVKFEMPLLKELSSKVDLFKDVHIMIANPLEMVNEFKNVGADQLTFHYEACKDDKEVLEVINKIHKCDMKAGISIKPATPVEKIFPFLKDLDIILVMSVEPGRGGQKFMEPSLERIAALRKEIDKVGSKALISVDGGINDVTAPKCLEAGVDVLVVGQYLFGHEDFLARYERLFK